MQTNSSKTIGIVAIILIIIAGVWLMTKRSAPVETVPVSTTETTTTTKPAEAEDPAMSGIQSSGTSNAALDSDSAAIDAEMSGFSSENGAAQTN